MIPYSSLYGTNKILSFYMGVISGQYPYIVCDAFLSESFYVNSEIDIWYHTLLFSIWYEENTRSFYMGVASGQHPYMVCDGVDPFAQLQPQGNMQCAWKSNVVMDINYCYVKRQWERK